MALPVEMVAGTLAVFAPEEVVEADFPGVRGRGVGRYVPADALEVFVGPSDHHHGVPSYDAVKAFFHVEVAGVGALVVGVDGVEVGRLDDLEVNACVFGRLDRGMKQTAGFVFAQFLSDSPNGIAPFLGANRVGVR